MKSMADTDPAPRENFRENCYRCFRPRASCFCDHIQPFEPRTRIVILMHPKENRKQRTGTGRLAHLCISGSRLFPGQDFTDFPEVNRLIEDPALFPTVLFPDETSRDISRDGIEIPAGRRLLVFVPDGTWRQARKILRLSPNLQDLPHIRFSPPEISRFLIKKEPRPNFVSTIESIHHLLGELERLGLEPAGLPRARLLDILDRLVRFQMDHASGRRRVRIKSRNGRPPSETGPAAIPVHKEKTS